MIAATGTMGKLYRLSESETADGSYESPVHDAGTVARWGQLSLARRPPRSGQTRLSHADREFRKAGPYLERVVGTDARSRGSSVTSPNARFIQWRAEFSGSDLQFSGSQRRDIGISAAE